MRTHRSSDSAERALSEQRALQGRRRAGQHTTTTAFPGALAQPQHRLPGLPGCRPLSLPNLRAKERPPHASSPFPWAFGFGDGNCQSFWGNQGLLSQRPRQELRGCAETLPKHGRFSGGDGREGASLRSGLGPLLARSLLVSGLRALLLVFLSIPVGNLGPVLMHR